MSWKDIDRDVIFITTGDKTRYAVLFRNPTKELKFNTEGFDFVGVDGTYVAREQMQGSQYPLEFYFDGENHIDNAKQFEESARNKNSWEIIHPIYGTFNCQPLSLTFDSSILNLTKVTGTVWETIGLKYPEEKTDVKSTVYETKGYLYLKGSWTNKLSPKSIDTSFKLNDLIDIDYSKLPSTNDQLIALKNQIREVSSFAQDLIDEPIRYVKSLEALLEFPIIIQDDVVNKIKKLKSIFLGLVKIADMTSFEPMASAILFASITTALESSFLKRADVFSVSNDILNMYELSKNLYEQELYQQDTTLSQKLDFAINYTVSNLYEIGLNSKQERNIILEADSNPIVLSHRFYGFSDESLDRFISENNISLNELLEVKKGRKLLWYV